MEGPSCVRKGDTTPEMQDGLMRLRKELDPYAGLRPAKAIACLEALTPFRPGLSVGADVMVLREMCGGAFFGEIARFAYAGFQLAQRRRGKLCSTDKANVMESGLL